MEKQKEAEQFIASFAFDQRLAEVDIIGSLAHVKMLSAKKIIPSKDAARIARGLMGILRDVHNGKRLPAAEDIHFAVEKELIRRIGAVGGKMHTARSRNDQVALDMRLYVRIEIDRIIDMIAEVQHAVLSVAQRHHAVIMPGYTHLQPAQPILFAHELLAYGWMLQRDRDRLSDCRRRVNVMPLGSAALAGTSFPIDRHLVARLLGFEAISPNSIDAVSDRDFLIEFTSALSLIAVHVSRLSEELIIWSSAEFGFIRLADQYTSGSSIMPQKRNPDVAELMRGKSSGVIGSLMTLLTLMKGLPLAYNRDMQEDKPPVFAAVDTVSGILEVLAPMLQTMTVHRQRMNDATAQGFMGATELADYLARAGVPFRTAHGIVHRMVLDCAKTGRTLQSLSIIELKRYSTVFKKDVFSYIELEAIVKAKASYGGTAPQAVVKQLNELRKMVGKRHG